MSPDPVIHIAPNGGTGNRMFQYMLALVVQARSEAYRPTVRVIGNRLPEWGYPIEPDSPFPDNCKKLVGHVFDLEGIVRRFAKGKYDAISIRSPPMRMAYYAAHLERFRALFALPRAEGFDFDRCLFMHARLHKLDLYSTGGMATVHRDYPFAPIRWFEQMVSDSGLEPVFVGQFGDNHVTEEFRRRFPGARIIRNDDAMEDYRLLYSATNVALSPSSFSWLAAWLSPWSREVHLPMLGIFNPDQRPDVDMLPIGDPRYLFYEFPAEPWLATDAQIDAAIHGTGRAPMLTGAKAADRLALASERIAAFQAGQRAQLQAKAAAAASAEA